MANPLRNFVHRRNHKERSQPVHRERLGLLEKKKDYVLRARDYHSKRDRIKRLQEKAAVRNKDEFYFGMIRGKTAGGVHIQDRGNQALPNGVVKLMKSQDINYVRTQRAAGKKRIDGLVQSIAPLLPFASRDWIESDEDRIEALRAVGLVAAEQEKKTRKGKSKAKEGDGTRHTVWVDEEQDAKSYTPATPSPFSAGDGLDGGLGLDNLDVDFDMEDDDLDDWYGGEDVSSNVKGKGKAKAGEIPLDLEGKDEGQRKKLAQKHLASLIRALSSRLKRERLLALTQREMELQKLLMGKGAKRKIETVKKGEQGVVSLSGAADAKGGRRTPGLALPGEDSDEERRKEPRRFKWKAERAK